MKDVLRRRSPNMLLVHNNDLFIRERKVAGFDFVIAGVFGTDQLTVRMTPVLQTQTYMNVPAEVFRMGKAVIQQEGLSVRFHVPSVFDRWGYKIGMRLLRWHKNQD